MFGRHFGRHHRGPWQEERHEPDEHGHGPEHHQHDCGPEEHPWESRGGHRPPFMRRGGGPRWFGPPDHDQLGRPFWRGGPPGGDPFDEDGGGRRRHRRGDIKFALLELLAEQPRHGYDLIKELEQRYGGFYRPSPGSVYPTLQLLEDEGHLTSQTLDGKRVYTITDSGRRLLEERQRRHPEGGPGRHGFRGRGEPSLDELRESGGALIASVAQAARHGTPEQVAAVMKLLDTTRREIYAILARGDEGQAG